MLTDSQVLNAKLTGQPLKIFDERGLYLPVMPNRGRYWRFNYQFNGKYKTLAQPSRLSAGISRRWPVHGSPIGGQAGTKEQGGGAPGRRFCQAMPAGDRFGLNIWPGSTKWAALQR